MKIAAILLSSVLFCVGVFGQASDQLIQAKQAYDSGDFAKAADLYRSVLGTDPQNSDALAGVVDSLDAKGEWRSAVPSLALLVSLQPDNTARAAQLGRWYSWQVGHKEEALRLLKTACAQSEEPKYCTDYADVLSWATATRPEAIGQLRSVLSRDPNYTPAAIRLAEILSWNRDTYPESLKLFQSAADREPKNGALLASYADVLASSHEHRSEALTMYARALAVDPNNTRAMTGKAQQLAWTGHSTDAMALYDRALAIDPNSSAALRGKAEILNWRGEYDQAAQYLKRAQESAPEDQRVAAELARAQMGLKNYGQAKQAASTLPTDPEYRQLREDVSRALATWTELGVEVRRNRQNLDYESLLAAISTPLGYSNRLTVHYAPTLFSTTSGDFNSNTFGLDLDSKLSNKLNLRLTAGSESYPGISPQFAGGLKLQFRPNSAWEIKTGFDRTPVDESYLSLRGTDLSGQFTGQVASNLGNIELGYNNAHHGLDFSVGYTDGLYTGSNLDSNRRKSVDGEVGKSFGGAPYFRFAYGVNYTAFDYDADAAIPAARQNGGYFSPQRYLLNYGSFTVSHKASDKIQFEATGTLGAQNVESTTSIFDNAQFASSFTGRLLWRVSAGNELRFQYEFLNVYNAFHRHVPAVTWRHYF